MISHVASLRLSTVTSMGPSGPSGTITLGTTTVLNPDQDPAVNNSGTTQAGILNLSLPRASDISVGSVVTGLPGTPVEVTNVGTDGDTVLDFTIPQGEGLVFRGAWANSTYSELNVVTHNNIAWVCSVESTTEEPGTGTDWDVLFEGVDLDALNSIQTSIEADRIQTGLDTDATSADRVQTGLDVTTTTENTEQTALDVLATAADRVQTGLDTVATGEDRVHTALDVIMTNADKVQTGEDRTQTGLDATATAADRVQTGLDTDATAADRVQTGLDKVSTAADRTAVANIFDQFDDRYLGAKTVDPTLDNDSNPLVAGQVYWNTVSESLRFYNGATWEDPTAQAATSATAAHNSATDAALSETNADADATQTALDRIATAADRVQTGLDTDATAADRAQTGLDATATASDRIQTGLDRTATAADRVQTGLDKDQTNADVVSTNADRIQTGLDVISTGDDAIATAADVVQTGLDVTDAEAAKTTAQKWAIENEDVEVETGEYSAKHHALKSAANAVQVDTDKTQTSLDAEATAADRIQTGLDVVSAEFAATTSETYKERAQEWAEKEEDLEIVTGSYSALHHAAKASADAEQTAADRIQTILDAAATSSDKTQTNADKVATAADRVQTGLDVIQTGEDVIATAADRVQTGLDATATSVDLIQTDADTQATAADRVQTGIDATAAATAQDKAEEWAVNPEGVEVETGLYSAKHYAGVAASLSDLGPHNASPTAHEGYLVEEAPLNTKQYIRKDGLWAEVDMTAKADKVTGAVENNFGALDAEGNLIDSGEAPASFDTSGTAADLLSTHETTHPAPTVRDDRNDLAGSAATVQTNLTTHENNVTDAHGIDGKVDTVVGSSLVADTEIAKIHAAGSDDQDLSGLVEKALGYSLVADSEIAKIHEAGSDDQDLSNLVVKETGKSLVLDTEISKIHEAGSDIQDLSGLVEKVVDHSLMPDSHLTVHPPPTNRDTRNDPAGFAASVQFNLDAHENNIVDAHGIDTKEDKVTGSSLVPDTEIAKIHAQNTDTALDQGGVNETAVADIRGSVNHTEDQEIIEEIINPTLDLDFENEKFRIYTADGFEEFPLNGVDSKFDFTRATTKTYFDAKGIMRTAAAGEMAIDYDPATGECLGVKIEGPGTNLLEHSQNQLDAYWGTNTTMGVAASTTVDPSGGTDAFILTANGDFSAFGKSLTGTVGLDYVFAIWMRRKTGTGIVELVIGDYTPQVVTSEISTDRWVRVWKTNQPTTTTVRAYVNIRTSGDEVEIFGAQLEPGSAPSSYIPTTTAAVTRNADQLKIDGTDFSDFYNQSEGTVFAEVLQEYSNIGRLLNITDGTSDNQIQITTTPDNVSTYIKASGTTPSAATLGSMVFGSTVKAALAFKSNDAAGVMDGGTVQTDDTVVIPNVDSFNIGYQISSEYLNGHIKRLTYWTRRLDDTQLQALTA